MATIYLDLERVGGPDRSNTLVYIRRAVILIVLSFSTMTSSRRVLHSPELLQSIFDSAGIESGARLARTSRHLFRVLAPLLWRNIEGSHILFMLLPGANVTVIENNLTIVSNVLAVLSLSKLTRSIPSISPNP